MRDVAKRTALPFFSARKAAFAASPMEVVAFEVAFLGAITGMIFQSTNGGRQMLDSLTHVRVGPSNGKTRIL
jgi:chemotaxis receptor (MCP) glutamine deamidase CheD